MGNVIDSKYTFLTTAPVSRVVAVMSVPTVISMLSTSIYNLIDTYFVSGLGTEATVAVGLSFTFMTLLQAIGFFLGHGTGNYIAIKLGAQNIEEARRMVNVGMTYAVILGIIILIIGTIFISDITAILGASPDVQPKTEIYLQWLVLSAPFMISSLMLSLQIRMQGLAKYAMIGIVCGMVVNLILDPILIFTYRLGIEGAGIATFTGQFVSCGILFMILTRTYAAPKFKVTSSMRYIRDIIKGGSPSLMRQGLGCISILLLNLYASNFGESAVAAMTVTTRITFIALSVITGLGQGFQPLCGFCYGAGLYDRIHKAFRFTVLAGTAILGGFMIVGLLFITDIFSLFSSNTDIVEFGTRALRYQLIAFPIEAFVIIASIFLQTINRTTEANIMVTSRKGLFFIPLICFLPNILGLQGVMLCQPICDVCAFLLAIPLISKTFSTINIKNIGYELCQELYNIQGLKVTNPTSGGIYIAKGKKFIKK